MIIREMISQDAKMFCANMSEGGNDVYNGSLPKPSTFEVTAYVMARNSAGYKTTYAQGEAKLMTSRGIAGVKRCFIYNKGKGWVDGQGFGSRSLRWVIDLDKTFENTPPNDISAEMEKMSKENADAMKDRKRPKNESVDSNSGLNTSGTDFAVDSMKFFDILYDYLTQQFDQNYVDGNVPREKFAINGNMSIITPPSFEQDNILKPTNTLFDRAAQGDADALEAMKNSINSGFGQSEEALKKFKDQFSSDGAIGQASKNMVDLAGQQYDPSSGNFKPSGLGAVSITTSGPSGQWSANTSDALPDGETAESETAKAVDSGNAQSTKLPNSTLQTIQGRQNASLPKPMQKGQWQPKANPVLRTKINTRPADYVPIGPILKKDI
jgi:hypothetical protein